MFAAIYLKNNMQIHMPKMRDMTLKEFYSLVLDVMLAYGVMVDKVVINQ